MIAPPYDVISKEEQDKLYKKSVYNFVRLDLNQEADSYNAVAQLLGEWQSQGILERDVAPAIYFSAHRFKLKSGEQKVRLGFFALTELQDFATGAIKPHEKTLDAPKEDRLKLMLACHAQLSPIFVLYAQPKRTIHIILSVAVEGMAPFIETELDNGDELQALAHHRLGGHRKSPAGNRRADPADRRRPPSLRSHAALPRPAPQRARPRQRQ